MVRTARLFALLCSVPAGCTPSSAPDSSTPSPSAVTSSSVPAKCAPDVRPKRTAARAGGERAAAIVAIAEGRTTAATMGLLTVLREDPNDLAADTLYAALISHRREVVGRASDPGGAATASKVAPTALASAAPAPLVGPKPASTGLVRASGTAPPYSAVSHGDTGVETLVLEPPDLFPPAISGKRLWRQFHDGPTQFAVYADTVLAFGLEAKGIRAYELGPTITEIFRGGGEWVNRESTIQTAVVVGSTLVIQLVYPRLGRPEVESALLAIDLETDRPIWRSDLRRSDVWGLYASGTHLVTAYSKASDKPARLPREALWGGGTAKVSVIRIADGAIVSEQQAPLYIDSFEGRGKWLYAVAKDRVEAFELDAAPERPAPKLGRLTLDSAPGRILEAEERCRLENAVTALDHRDGAAAALASARLPQDWFVARALKGIGEALAAPAGGPSATDLTAIRPALVEKPRAAAAPSAPATAKWRLSPTKPVNGKPATFEPRDLPSCCDYADKAKTKYPERFGIWRSDYIVPAGETSFVSYGGRYLFAFRDTKPVGAIDFSPWVGELGPTHLPVLFGSPIDGVLLAWFDDALAAVEPQTGKVRWQTAQPLASPLVFDEEVLVAAKAGDKHELRMLRLSDGASLQTIALRNEVRGLSWDERGYVDVELASGGHDFFALE